MKTTNKEILKKLKSCKNVVTASSYESILMNRGIRGDVEAITLLYQYLKGWK